MNIFKVKRPRTRAIKNNKLILIPIGTIATIFLLILLKAWLNRDKGQSITGNITSVFTPEKLPTKEKELKLPETPAEKKALALDQVHTVIRQRMAEKSQSAKGQQEKLKDYFQQLIRLKINLPGHLHYTTVDPEEGIGGLYGTSIKGDESFAVLATRTPVTMKEIQTFLTEANPSLPMLRDHKLIPEKIFTEKAPEKTGLASITVIPMTEKGDMGVFAVFAPRADGKGSYLFLREGNKDTFESNDGYYDQMLEEMQAQP